MIGLSSNAQEELVASEKIKRSLSEWFQNDTSNFFSVYDGQGNRILQNETVDDRNAWLSITKRIASTFPSRSVTVEFSSEVEAEEYERSLQKTIDPEIESLETDWVRREDGTICLTAQW